MTLKTRIVRLEGRHAPSISGADVRPELIRRINALATRMQEAGTLPDPTARIRVLEYLTLRFETVPG